MTPRLMTVPPSMGLRDLVDFLRENRIHGALVKEGDQLVGVVSYSDVLTFLADNSLEGEHPFSRLFSSDEELDISEEMNARMDAAGVREVMTPAVFTVEEGASAGEVASEMIRRNIHRAVVVENGQAVGLVSATDLLKAVVDYEKELKKGRSAASS